MAFLQLYAQANTFSLRLALIMAAAIGGCVMGAIGLGIFIKYSTYFSDTTFPTGWEGYTAFSFSGLVFFTFCSSVGASLLVVGARGVSTSLASRGVVGAKQLAPMLVPVVVFAVTGLVAIPWAHEVLRCGFVNCTTDVIGPEISGLRPEAGLGWKVVAGMAVLISGIATSAALAASLLVRLLVESQTTHGLLLRPSAANWVVAVLLPCFALFFWYLSGTVPNSWEYFSAPRLGGFLQSPTAYFGSVPELPWAWFVSSSFTLSSQVVVKLYPSSYFYFGYLTIVACLVVAVNQVQLSRRFLSRRLCTGMSAESPIRRFLMRFTLGELIISVLTTAMVVLFFIYWAQSHNFNGYYPATVAPSENWARAFGQLTVCFLSLLLFPASRNSVLYRMTGTSWEAFLWMHRVLGVLMLLSLIAHMVAWYVKYYEVGLFPANILKAPMTLPTTVDNWTVPLVTLTSFFLLVAVGIGALPVVRRRFFEVFYHLHIIAAYTTIPAVLWHAAAGWEYMLPGLTVWFMDRVIRLFRSAAPATVVNMTLFHEGEGDLNQEPSEQSSSANEPLTGFARHGSVLEIRFHLPGRTTVAPGEYVFLNVPQVSLLEWHPFTISSGHSSEKGITVHIKSMGPDTWTERVIAAAEKAVANATHLEGDDVALQGIDKHFQLYADGPYGNPLCFSDYEQVVLIAGGIGVTPCASIFAAIQGGETTSIPPSAKNVHESGSLDMRCDGPRTCAVRRVTLLWSVRKASEVRALMSTLSCGDVKMGSTASHGTLFSKKKLPLPTGFQQKSGRPNYATVLRDLTSGEEGIDPHKTLVFVCGPESMVHTTMAAAVELGCHFHNETFEL